MRQRLACGDSLPRIKRRHLTNQVFKDRVDAFPQGKRSSRILLVKSISDDAKYLLVGVPMNIFEEPLYPLRVCKVRDLTFENVGEDFLSFTKFAFVDGEDDAFVDGVDALHSVYT